ncbi:unnamed protein product [Gongylonema pulchrum]|uniref:Uncharacterized protein n=1 Tax=Gongylonema pulchrum TaxID=637853 RepID=A0A3P7PKU6_9BILA|nr:unnamed protein product [Gongylonema pulchrum]
MKNLVVKREADYALCVAHENLMTDDAQLKIALVHWFPGRSMHSVNIHEKNITSERQLQTKNIRVEATMQYTTYVLPGCITVRCVSGN